MSFITLKYLRGKAFIDNACRLLDGCNTSELAALLNLPPVTLLNFEKVDKTPFDVALRVHYMYRYSMKAILLGQLTSDDMALIGASFDRPTKELQFMTGLEMSQKLSDVLDLSGHEVTEAEQNELISIQSEIVTNSTYDPKVVCTFILNGWAQLSDFTSKSSMKLEIVDLGTGSSNAMPPVCRLTGSNLIDKLAKLTGTNGIYGLSLAINEPLEALIRCKEHNLERDDLILRAVSDGLAPLEDFLIGPSN